MKNSRDLRQSTWEAIRGQGEERRLHQPRPANVECRRQDGEAVQAAAKTGVPRGEGLHRRQKGKPNVVRCPRVDGFNPSDAGATFEDIFRGYKTANGGYDIESTISTEVQDEATDRLADQITQQLTSRFRLVFR